MEFGTQQRRRGGRAPWHRRRSHAEVIVVLKCPFCGFANEDGALFCEQCKSDVSGVAPVASSAPPATPMPDSIPIADVIPLALEEAPVMAAIVDDEPVMAAV